MNDLLLLLGDVRPAGQVADTQRQGTSTLLSIALTERGLCASQGKAGTKMYKDFEADRNRGDFSVLPELHSVLSGMKVLTSPLHHADLRPTLSWGGPKTSSGQLPSPVMPDAGAQHVDREQRLRDLQEGLRRPRLQPALGPAHPVRELRAECDLGG